MSRKSLIALSIRDNVAWIVLDAPPKNELTPAFFDEWHDLVTTCLPRLAVTGLVLHGRGRHFSSGARVEALSREYRQRGAHAYRKRLARNQRAFAALGNLPYPAVAAVGGVCFGAALELALCCRVRIASSRALFALPESTFGLMPGCGGTVKLGSLLTPGKAAEILLSGRTFDADEARRLGIVHLVTSKREVTGPAYAILSRLAGKSGGGSR